MAITAEMLALLSEKIQSPSTPKGKAAYVKSLAAWAKAASKVATSYADKLGDLKDAQGSMSGATLVASLDKLLSNVSGELDQVATQIEKLK